MHWLIFFMRVYFAVVEPYFPVPGRRDAVLHKCLSWELWSTCARSMRRYICVMNSADAFSCMCAQSLHTSVIQSALCCPLVCKSIKHFRISFLLSKNVKL